jgi:endonuclease G
MDRAEKLTRLKAMLRQIAASQGEEALHPPRAPGPDGFERAGEEARADSGLRKVLTDRERDVDDEELRGLEAIILPRGRPVVFIRDGTYEALPDPWTHLNAAAVRGRIEPLFPSIGRVELPNSLQLAYGGTAFVVGPGLLMTNRHVARLFTEGIGVRGLVYRAGDAAVDFKREVGSPEDDHSAYVEVESVAMVHPYWDMALIRVAGLPAVHRPLKLSVRPPQDLVERDVVAVGYPGRDSRNDLDVQDRIFRRTYDVKRLQPGQARPRARIRSFENVVDAMTHDSSTLGGNSGSAVVDVQTGEVVGLHFAGMYLRANYAVPTYELARDARVVEAGLTFAGRVAPTDDWADAWGEVGSERRPSAGRPVVLADGNGTTWEIPIRVSVSIGSPSRAGAAPVAAEVEARRMQPPVIYPRLGTRKGYRPDFLDLPGGEEVPLPTLTAAGKRAAAELDDGVYELKYHKFSVVMHKKRRLALFTAANVDWRPESREVDGEVPTRKMLTEIPEGTIEEWVTDRRISLEHQLPDVFFTKDRTAFDKGHLVRRDDVCWGARGLSGDEKFRDIQKGNGDTYHTTNCSPQVKGFNQAVGEDNWGDLEKMIQRETGAETVILFAGPVLAEDDREFQGRDLNGEVWVPIPSRYWKVVVAAGDDGPKAYGFVLEQDLSDVRFEEFAVPPEWRGSMRTIEEIEGMLFGLAMLPWLKRHDGFDTEEGRRMATQARALRR